ncbi:MAG: hypothetical protein QM747_07305 [Nocardioides sp.]
MPRRTNVALATSALVSLTLGVGTYQSVDARPATPSAVTSNVTASASSAAPQGTCAPKYTTKKPLFGLNLGGLMSGNWGKVPALRSWINNDNIGSTWKAQTRTTTRKTALVISIRRSPQEVIQGKWDSELNAFFKHAPKKRLVFWNYYHEPETPVRAHEFTPAQFRRAFRHIGRIAAQYCRPNLVPTLVLMGWTADPRSGASVNYAWKSWRDFYPGRHYVSVVAWDPYNSVNAAPRSYGAPRELYRETVVASRHVHKRWAIAETGSARIASDPSGSGRAAWLHRVAKYSRKHDAAFVTYFDQTGIHNDFRLTDTPSANAWRQIMNQ